MVIENSMAVYSLWESLFLNHYYNNERGRETLHHRLLLLSTYCVLNMLFPPRLPSPERELLLLLFLYSKETENRDEPNEFCRDGLGSKSKPTFITRELGRAGW